MVEHPVVVTEELQKDCHPKTTAVAVEVLPEEEAALQIRTDFDLAVAGRRKDSKAAVVVAVVEALRKDSAYWVLPLAPEVVRTDRRRDRIHPQHCLHHHLHQKDRKTELQKDPKMTKEEEHHMDFAGVVVVRTAGERRRDLPVVVVLRGAAAIHKDSPEEEHPPEARQPQNQKKTDQRDST